jgi:penicillin-binding protein 1A
MKKLTKILTWLFSLGLTLFIVGGLGVLAAVYYFSQDLPDYGKLGDYKPAMMTRIYADNGQLIGEYAKEKRVFLPLQRIPLKVRQAFIAAEDKNFYHHQGIDAMGLLRAVLNNIRQVGAENKSLAGGSTITQQVVKNFLLTREKSIARKAKEAILSFRITNTFSKDQILELYLNQIYLGLGAHGVAVSAQRYFNKSLGELTTEEAALLAAMPKAPSLYDPRFYKDKAMERRNYVLARMYEDGYVNKAEYDRARAAPIVLRRDNQDDDTDVRAVNWFPEEVRRDLVQRFGEEAVYTGGCYVKTTANPYLQEVAEKALRNALIAYDRRHGYRGALVTLKLDNGDDGWKHEFAKQQAHVASQLFDGEMVAVVTQVDNAKAHLWFGDKQEGEMLYENMKWARKAGSKGASDIVQVGDVILVQSSQKELPPEKKKEDKKSKDKKKGKDAKDAKDSKESADVAATDNKPKTVTIYSLHQIPKVNGAMMAVEPQTGRVLAMVGGYSPAQFNRATQALRQPGSSFKPFVYLSALEHGFSPSTIILDAPVELYQGPGLPMWRPKNYEDEFLGPATMRMGLEKSRNLMTVRLAQRLGIQRIVRIGKRFGIYDGNIPANYSMVLGSVETTLSRLIGAYSMIANGGWKVTPTLIDRIDDANGNVIYRADTAQCQGCAADGVGGNYATDKPPVLPEARAQVLDARIAYQMQSMLQGVVQRGTAVSAKVLNMPVGGKTGTTNDSRDVWFMGISPEIAVGVYIGFDQPATLGKKETGGRVSLPAFIEFMKTVFEEHPVSDFRKPKGVVQVAVDRYTGMPPLPWSGGATIIESFLTGGAIFIPESDQDEKAGEQNSGDDAAADEPQADAGAQQVNPAPPVAEQGQVLTPPTAPQVVTPSTQNAPYDGAKNSAVTSDAYTNYRAYRKEQVQKQQQSAPSTQPSNPVNVGTGGLY